MNPKPKSYFTYAEFVRDEVRPNFRVGFSVDDLEQEATFRLGVDEIDDEEPKDLDFDMVSGF